jgi:hypothetical protein
LIESESPDADSLRLRAGKVSAIRRAPERAVITGTVIISATIMGATIMAEILAEPAELW